jgi:hypothetical protein
MILYIYGYREENSSLSIFFCFFRNGINTNIGRQQTRDTQIHVENVLSTD